MFTCALVGALTMPGAARHEGRLERNMFQWLGRLFWTGLFAAAALVPSSHSYVVPVSVGLIGLAVLRFRIDFLLKIAIVLSFAPIEPPLFAFGLLTCLVALLLVARGRCRLAAPHRYLALFLGWCFVSYLLNQVATEWNPLSFGFFAITFLTPASFFVLATYDGLDSRLRGEAASFLIFCAAIQAALVLIQGRQYVLQWAETLLSGDLMPALLDWRLGQFVGDWGRGSVWNQHTLTFSFSLALFLLASRFILRGGSGRQSTPSSRYVTVVTALLILLGVYFTAAKTVAGCALLGSALGLVHYSLVRFLRSPRLRRRHVAAASSGILIVVVAVAVGLSLFGGGYFVRWFETGKSNHKLKHLERALNEIPATYGTLLTGTGPGTVGTRAANSRAYDTMYKYRVRVPDFVSPFTSRAARSHFVDLYQEDFALSMRWRSSILSHPFSSMISVLVELGVAGLLIFLLFFLVLAEKCGRLFDDVRARASDRQLGLAVFLAIPTVLALSFFDTIFERPGLIVPFWILAGLAMNAYHQCCLPAHPRSIHPHDSSRSS